MDFISNILSLKKRFQESVQIRTKSNRNSATCQKSKFVLLTLFLLSSFKLIFLTGLRRAFQKKTSKYSVFVIKCVQHESDAYIWIRHGPFHYRRRGIPNSHIFRKNVKIKFLNTHTSPLYNLTINQALLKSCKDLGHTRL